METEVEKADELIVTEEAPEDAKAVVPNLSADTDDVKPDILAAGDSHHVGCNAVPSETAVITNGELESSDPESPPTEASEHTCCPAGPEEKPEDEKPEPPIVFKRDPGVTQLMDSYAGKAKEMKEAIMETLNSRLGNENSPAGAAASSFEEEAARRLSLLKQVIQKNAVEAAQSSKPPEQTSTPPSSSSPVPRKEPCASRKSPSPMPERVRCEKSPSPAAAPPKCCTPPECVTAHCEKKTPEPAATSDNASQARTPCCGMRRSPLRKMGAQEANCAAAAKRKGERAVENVLKILEPHETAEEKLGALFQHYLGFQEGTWQLQAAVQKAERQVRQLSREKEQLQSECNRALLAKSKLESLCRELQKQCRTVKDECLMRIRDEEEKRREVASKFQTTLLDITAVLEENQSRSLQLKEENTQLAQRLKALIDHYDVWEKNVDNVLQQKELQVQVTATHLARAQAQLQQERQAFMAEKQMVLKQVSDSERKTAELVARESHLRQELSSHATKYEEFQGALTQSNQLFRNFKLDMEKMSKKIKKLEKETVQWKSRWEASNKALTEITAEKQSRDKELEAAQQRVGKLEKLCRALQLERNELSQKVKELGPTTATEETEATTATTNEVAED
ncbi:alpha-taxilin-like [Amblyomma americanum]